MAGETIKERGVCLAIRPWSRTSHVVKWLTESGVVITVVKGAERAKSAFLGQYDLNYTCEILYYARGRGDVHALRECAPLMRRDALRRDFRALAIADWFRYLVAAFAPMGPEARNWLHFLEGTLDALRESEPSCARANYLAALLAGDLTLLRLAGLAPEMEGEKGAFHLRGERKMPISDDVMRCLRAPRDEKNIKILVDTARVISVYYSFHLDCPPEIRRAVLRMICS